MLLVLLDGEEGRQCRGFCNFPPARVLFRKITECSRMFLHSTLRECWKHMGLETNTLEMHVWNAFRASHHRACAQANMVKRNRLPPQMSFLTFRVNLAASSKAQQTDTIGGAEIPGYTWFQFIWSQTERKTLTNCIYHSRNRDGPLKTFRHLEIRHH